MDNRENSGYESFDSDFPLHPGLLPSHDEMKTGTGGYVDTGLHRGYETESEAVEPIDSIRELEHPANVGAGIPTADTPWQQEYNWLVRRQADCVSSPDNEVLLRMRDDAAVRYYRAFEAANRDQDRPTATAAAQSADLLESSDTPAVLKEFLVMSAIVVGAAILSGAASGIVGALLVKEVISKEVIKGAIAGLITSTAMLAAERALDLRAQRHGTSSAANASAPKNKDLPDRSTPLLRPIKPVRQTEQSKSSDPYPMRAPSILGNTDPELGAIEKQHPWKNYLSEHDGHDSIDVSPDRDDGLHPDH